MPDLKEPPAERVEAAPLSGDAQAFLQAYRRAEPSSERMHQNLAALRQRLDRQQRGIFWRRWLIAFGGVATAAVLLVFVFRPGGWELLTGHGSESHHAAAYSGHQSSSSGQGVNVLPQSGRRIQSSTEDLVAKESSLDAVDDLVAEDETGEALEWLERLEQPSLDEEQNIASEKPEHSSKELEPARTVRKSKSPLKVGRGASTAERAEKLDEAIEVSPLEDRLKLEVSLISELRRAMLASEYERAIKLATQHEKEFRKGVLVEERRAWKAVAQCQLGHLDQGRASATKFLRQHPQSPHLNRVKRACSIQQQ